MRSCQTKLAVLGLTTVMATLLQRGMSLMCYTCLSMGNPDCGPLFKPHSSQITNCSSRSTSSSSSSSLSSHRGYVCALQRQRAISKIGQIAAIARDCFHADPTMAGLNSSVGCRTWTSPDNYTALYCFCDTDLCNAAAAGPRWRFHAVVTHRWSSARAWLDLGCLRAAAVVAFLYAAVAEMTHVH